MDALQSFRLRWGDELRFISRLTQGEYDCDDLCQEAWLLVCQWCDTCADAAPFDWSEESCQRELLARLRRKFAWADRSFRRAARLDHGARRSDGEEAPSLLDRLVADEGRDPSTPFIEDPPPPERAEETTLPLSLALAWVVLLRQVDNRMHAVARRLMISTSYAYQCCAKAKAKATYQLPMPLHGLDRTQVGSWRHHRIVRVPRQLSFDFDPVFQFVG